MTPATQVRAGRRVVRVKRPDKPLFGEGGATKLDLARYYTRVAPLMLPQVRGRPVALERLPDGIDGERFYVKHPPAPDWVRHVQTSGGRMIMCQDTAALVWCADQAALTQHVWLSREPRLGRPDRMVWTSTRPAAARKPSLPAVPPRTRPGRYWKAWGWRPTS